MFPVAEDSVFSKGRRRRLAVKFVPPAHVRNTWSASVAVDGWRWRRRKHHRVRSAAGSLLRCPGLSSFCVSAFFLPSFVPAVCFLLHRCQTHDLLFIRFRFAPLQCSCHALSLFSLQEPSRTGFEEIPSLQQSVGAIFIAMRFPSPRKTVAGGLCETASL